jgi:hypothetical protein
MLYASEGVISLAADVESGEKFRIGTVLGRTWSVLWTRPAMFLGLSLLLLAADVLKEWLEYILKMRYGFLLGRTAGEMLPKFVSSLFMLIFILLFQGAITYAVFQIFKEGRASVIESLRRSFSRVAALMLMALSALLALAAIMLLSLLAVNFLVFVPALIVSIPAIILSITFICKWYAAAPACIVEKTGPLKSLRRSGDLTSGHVLKIFGLLIFVVIIAVIISAVTDFIIKRAIGPGLTGGLIRAAVNVLPFAFVNTMATVVYYCLRAEKEDFIPATLADIFD